MSVIPRTSHTPNAPSVARIASASILSIRWDVSRRAVAALRPDWRFRPDGGDLQLRWTLRVVERADDFAVTDARAELVDRHGATEIPRTLHVCERAAWKIRRDVGAAVVTIESGSDRGELLSICVDLDAFAGDSASNDHPSDARSESLLYARTSLLNAPAPEGLGLAGGRYEAADAIVRRDHAS